MLNPNSVLHILLHRPYSQIGKGLMMKEDTYLYIAHVLPIKMDLKENILLFIKCTINSGIPTLPFWLKTSYFQ